MSKKEGKGFEFGGFKGKSATVSMAEKRVQVARLGWIPMQKVPAEKKLDYAITPTKSPEAVLFGQEYSYNRDMVSTPAYEGWVGWYQTALVRGD